VVYVALRLRVSALKSLKAKRDWYDPVYYADKLDDWLERYGPFLGVAPQGGAQGELL
jgi:hypothetical protein